MQASRWPVWAVVWVVWALVVVGCGGLSHVTAHAPQGGRGGAPRPASAAADAAADATQRAPEQVWVWVEPRSPRPQAPQPQTLSQPLVGQAASLTTLAPAAAAAWWGQVVAAPPSGWEAVEVYTAPGDLPRLIVLAESGDEVLAVGEGELPLRHTAVDAMVAGQVAEVWVSQAFENVLGATVEAVYMFPLPEGAAVHGMRLEVAGRTIEGAVMEREAARALYEDAKAEGYVAALLEQERPNVFSQSVANIPPGEQVRIGVRYIQDITCLNMMCEFVFPMVVGPRYSPGGVLDGPNLRPSVMGVGERDGHEISIDIKIQAGTGARDLSSPTHAIDVHTGRRGDLRASLQARERIPNKDFVLRYAVGGDTPQISALSEWSDDQLDSGGYLSVTLYPPHPTPKAAEIGPREVLFVIDASGSMRGLPIALAQDTLRDALQRLRPIDTFNILLFASGTRRLFAAAQPANPANLSDALSFVASMQAGGGTDLIDALAQALEAPLPPHTQRVILLATDGYIAHEEGTLRLIADHIHPDPHPDPSATPPARVFTLGLGSSPNRYLIEQAARLGHGLPSYALTPADPPATTARVFSLIDLPILTDVVIDWGDLPISDVTTPNGATLFATHPLTLRARYAHPAQGTITAQARAPDGSPVTLSAAVTLSGQPPTSAHRPLRALWARAKVEDLTRDLLFGAPPDVIRAQVIAIGQRFGLVTPFTSLIAIDPTRRVGDGAPFLIEQPVYDPEGSSSLP